MRFSLILLGGCGRDVDRDREEAFVYGAVLEQDFAGGPVLVSDESYAPDLESSWDYVVGEVPDVSRAAWRDLLDMSALVGPIPEPVGSVHAEVWTLGPGAPLGDTLVQFSRVGFDHGIRRAVVTASFSCCEDAECLCGGENLYALEREGGGDWRWVGTAWLSVFR